ncbi:MAG: SCO family protein [Phycisphaerales bacterium]|nr:SCO family protein [Phycisphaerales bacterium]
MRTSTVHLNALLIALMAMTVSCLTGHSAWGQEVDPEFNEDLPKELIGVTIVEHLDETVPLDLEFTNQENEKIVLRDLFDGERPVILQMGYYRCPMLCNLVLNEAISGLQGVKDLSAGDDFQLISVSVNPDESHELASVKRQGYLLEYNRDGAGKGFHFLVGSEENSKALADSVGFQYRLQPDGEYAHAAALFIITPDGRISRYLYGVTYEPRTLRFALMEGAEGRIGSTLQRFILWCHIYDPDSGSYVLLAFRLMQLGGLVTLLVLVVGVGWLWLRDRDRDLAVNRPIVQGAVDPADPGGGTD